MEINIIQADMPTREDVSALLNNHFQASGYDCSLFGYGHGKSILVKKNAFVAARVFVNSNKRKIIIRGSLGIPYLVAVPFLQLIAVMFSFFKNITDETYTILFEQYRG